MNKPQAEERVNSRLYSIMQEKKIQHSSAIKKQWSTIVILSEVIFLHINMLELDHQKVSSKDIG